jgi:hypothetical protein
VDDEAYEVAVTDVIARIKVHGAAALGALGSLASGLTVDGPEEAWRDELQGRWAALSKPDQMRHYIDVAALDGSEAVTHTRFASVVGELLPVPTEPLLPDDWLRRQKEFVTDRCINDSGTERCQTLVLFDLDLSKVDRGVQGGQSLAIQLLTEHQGVDIVCGIVSSRRLEDAQAVLLEGLRPDLDPNQVVRIAKADLPDKPWQFVYGLKKALLAPRVARLRLAARELVNEAHSHAMAELAQVDVFDFVYAVINRSDLEGVRDWETLFRLYHRFFSDDVRRLALAHEGLGDIGDAIRELAKLAPEAAAAEDLGTWRLQRREILDAISDVNRFYLPLVAGDVFECRNAEGAHKLYVLLAPPCDLMVRADGKRRLTSGLLVPLGEVSSARSEEAGTSKEIPYFREDGRPSSVKFADCVSVPLWVLDLCVFQSDGVARLTLGGSAPTNLTKGWLARHAAVVREVERVVNEARREVGGRREPGPRGRDTGGDRPEGGTRSEVSPAYNLPARRLGVPFQRAHVELATGSLVVDCRRVDRIRPAYTADLLTRLGHYLSRAAFETDLGKGTLASYDGGRD